MKLIPVVVALLFFLPAFGQNVDSLNRQAGPKGGAPAVALVYYKIDFTPRELEYLRANEAELIFMVSETGKAVLEKVNDIALPSIIDSMMRVNDRLPEFYPEIVDGKAQNSLYFLRIRWPHYEPMQSVPFGIQGNNYFSGKTDEFEYITYGGPRFDMLVGGAANGVTGGATDYIRNGGGMKFDIMFYGEKGWGGGMIMAFHGNESKKDYPISTPLPQDRTRMTIFLGVGLGKTFEETGPGHFNIQFEPSWVLQNIVAVDQQVKNKPVQASGFSPGIVANYSLRLGKGRLTHSYYYYMPTVVKSYINFHIGVRPMMYNLSAASGTMYEAGVSYRLVIRHVKDFKPKQQ